MISKTERCSTPGFSCANSQALGKAVADVAKRCCMIRLPRRAWLVGLGLAAGITLAAGGSARAADQPSSPNANVVDQLLALVTNASTIAPSSVPKCGSPASATNPFIILPKQTYALCAVASCFVFNEVAYCKCDVKTGDSISLALDYDDGKDVCTVNEEGAKNGSYMVSTYSYPESAGPSGDKAIYTCPGATSNGAYAQCDGGICATSTQGRSFPGFEKPLAKDEIICSCPITEAHPKTAKVGYQISGPYPCRKAFFENCKSKTANNKTGSRIYVGAPTGTPRLLTYLLYGTNKPANNCR
jgi:hypothetical protein